MTFASGMASASKQSGAVKTAARTAAEATKYGIDVMYQMWERAQADFAPFLAAGGQGLATLTQNMPQYMNQVLAPLAQQIAMYQPSNVVNPQLGQVNPVTGEIMQPSNMQLQYQNEPMTLQQPQTPTAQATPAAATQTAQTTSTPAGGTGAATTGGTGAATTGSPPPTVPTAPTMPSQYMDTSPYEDNEISIGAAPNRNYEQEMAKYYEDLRKYNEDLTSYYQQVDSGKTGGEPTPAQPLPYAQPTQAPTAGQQLQLPNYQVGATQEQMQQGGVLSPLTPTLPGQIDMQWNPDDPVYQYKLKQAEDAQKRYLAQIGGTDSSAALTKMRDTGLAVAAEDIDKQFARDQSERNYLAQKAADEYAMQAARGQTLYDRQRTAGNEAYARNQQALSQYDEDRLNNLMRAYNAYSNQYGLGYGAGLDLAKIGAGQAGAAGASSIQTGQNISGAYNQMGENQANAGLAQSQVWANYMGGLQNQSAQIGTSLMKYLENQTPTSGGGNYSGYTASPVSSGSWLGNSAGYGAGFNPDPY